MPYDNIVIKKPYYDVDRFGSYVHYKSIERRKKLLANENYVNKAPKKIVELDRKKLKEEEEKLKNLLDK